MSPRKRIQNKITIEPIFLLNTPIEELYEKGYINTRVYLNLRAVKVKNLSEFREVIFSRHDEEENARKLEIFGRRSVQEINALFHQARIKIPEMW